MRGVTCVILLLAVSSTGSTAPRDCPTPNLSLASAGGAKSEIEFSNLGDEDLNLYWVDGAGEEHEVQIIPALEDSTHGSFISHVFRVRRVLGGVGCQNAPCELVGEYVVDQEEQTFGIHPCGSIKSVQQNFQLRDQEFQALSQHHLNVCDDSVPSSTWSCYRCVDEAEFKGRSKAGYGFSEYDTPPNRAEGEQTDTTYIEQIPYIRKLTEGAGYLRMNMTDKIKESLLSWYKNKRDAGDVVFDEVVGGGYTNSENKPFGMISLDNHVSVREAIVGEMKQVLQWWTKQSLRHTATYGVRVYPRDAVLINHVDREDTHLASAVLQVDQQVDADGGWPLEVLTPAGYPCEVYLQPGEMVLYEGARIKHGRPMRFRGEEFANVFSHFKPRDWTGTQELRSKWESGEIRAKSQEKQIKKWQKNGGKDSFDDL